MPKKRPHKKSRYGCDQCRKRRVKCDELLPRCTTCTHRGEECRFPPRQIGQYNSPAYASADTTPPQSAESDRFGDGGNPIDLICGSDLLQPATLSFQQIPITDAALMQHWCTRTCDSFTKAKSDLFRGHVAEEALRHAYLMEALRALTLLHMASELSDPAAAGPLVTTALHHLNQCCFSLREALGSISPSNCDAVYASAVLIMVCGLLSPLLSSGEADQARPNVNSVLSLIDFMNGIKSILRLSRQWIMQGPMASVFSVFETTPTDKVEWAPAGVLRALMYDTQSSLQYGALDSAIQGLENVFRREHCSVVWLTRLDPDFVEELRKGEPFATLICIHWGVLLYATDDMWWKRYSGAKLVDELSLALQGHDERWDQIIKWSRQQVGL